MKISKFDKNGRYTNNNQTNNDIYERIKTTNINILLNRVRIKNKNNFKKKIFFVISIVSILLFVGFILLRN
jgi:ribonucleotide reductase beta subunit family protein with ferritin-like domain